MVRLFQPHALIALSLGLAAAPAWAQSATDKDEKLPAQLPSVTIQGEDLSGTGAGNQHKVAPSAGLNAPRVRLPDPPHRRATSEGNRSLMVNVTPSTLEPPSVPPGPVLPYTSLTGGWGPLTQYQLGLYDTRMWGPALGITELAGRSGWGWSDWRAKEWIDWAGVGRLGLQGDGFAWNDTKGLLGNQMLFSATAEHGESEAFIARVGLEQGLANGAGSLSTSTASAQVEGRPAALGDHQLTLAARAQYRVWGNLSGPEGYLEAADFWSLSDAVQLEAGLGGGYWGFEPVLNPKAAFHYRPQSATHLYASLRTASELPDFKALYLRHPYSAVNTRLQAERVEGWAEVGGSHRFNDDWWGSVDFDLRRSHRHIYWMDLDGDTLWTPVNATSEQFSPGVAARLQRQWARSFSQALTAGWKGVYPLGMSEARVGTNLEGAFLEDKLGVVVGLGARVPSLSAQQVATAGSGLGVFAEASFSYALNDDWRLSLTAEDVPIALRQPAANYFTPVPLLTGNVQYQF